MIEILKERVWRANLELQRSGLVVLTWGNVSEIDRDKGLVAIKPSGIRYEDMRPTDIVVVDLDGRIVEGELSPSSDLPTHLELYRAFPEIGGITHTHSRWATVFSQAGMPIPALGTTHADTFHGAIPCTRRMTPEQIGGEYEKETGKVIAEAFAELDPMATPAALVVSHGPFIWGANAAKSVENALVLEEVAMMAWHTLAMNPEAAFQKELSDKHYYRKHGPGAYYGQRKCK